MKAIWKFPLLIGGQRTTIEMHLPAQVVHVASQEGRLCLWARVDTDQPVIERRFFVHGTGHEIPDDRWHVGTALMDGPFGGLVFHVFADRVPE